MIICAINIVHYIKDRLAQRKTSYLHMMQKNKHMLDILLPVEPYYA